MLVLLIFSYSAETGYVKWFYLTLLLTIAVRFLFTRSFKKNEITDFSVYADIYVMATLVIGANWALLILFYHDLPHQELRHFLSFVGLALMAAAVGALSCWMPAYLSFSLPLLVSMTTVFIVNENYFVAFALLVYGWFMWVLAKNSNLQFKESRHLLQENAGLIEKMAEEIESREMVQQKLELYKNELESLISERTKELLDTNKDLQEQIAKRSQIEQDLENLAYYDVLTGLPNRSLLIERLKRAITVASRNQSLVSVLFVDLDRFKSINDSLGHAIGDKLLQQVAERLRQLLRASDTIARNGGDEFVILTENLNDVREAFVVAEKIIQAISQNFLIDDHEMHIGASIGISLYPLDGEEALDLLKMADTAMYCAKESGTNQFEFYSSQMSKQIQDRLKLENALRAAIANDEFYLVYQPQFDIINKRTSGLEALIRWRSPELGLVSPISFIPVLEETGLIYQVGEWVIEQAVSFIKSGHNQATKVSINLSALQCSSKELIETIQRIIEQAKIDPKMLEFEITESVLINDFKQTEKFLNDLNALGCTIALDDFGTGYTSFSYLAKLPIDAIKIDRSLVTHIDQQQNLQDIVRAIVTMSESLGIENIFEGVETEAELEKVRELQGRLIQGYLFSKPLEVSQLTQWFEQEQRDQITQ